MGGSRTAPTTITSTAHRDSIMANPGNHMGLPLRGNDPVRGWVFRFGNEAHRKKLDRSCHKWYAYIVNPIRGCAFRLSKGVKIYEPPFLLSQESRGAFSKEVNYGQFKDKILRDGTTYKKHLNNKTAPFISYCLLFCHAGLCKIRRRHRNRQ